MSELKELVITSEEYKDYLAQRLRLSGSAQEEIQKISFPFLFSSGSELLRTFILSKSEFTATLPDRLKLPDRGFIWYLFSQAVREISITGDRINIKYELQEDYKKPFKQFYL